MTSDYGFCPDWASPPGDTISDILDERKLSLDSFAESIGHTVDQVQDLLRGRLSITSEIAWKLEGALGASATFWMNREVQYREEIERAYKLEDDANSDWLDELPVPDMVRFGWVPYSSSRPQMVSTCLDFFATNNVAAWRQKYSALLATTAYRTSASFDSESGALAAWLRQGEILGSSIACNKWNPERFRDALNNIRLLTRESRPSVFLPELIKMCADCGVAVVIVRAPTGCRASGATRFLSRTRALLLLSFRYLSDDHFWFSFFHEAAHLLLHGQESTFVEGGRVCDTKEEREANDFAALTLIPTTLLPILRSLSADARNVIRFARKAGVSRGIVVGQLQHLGIIERNQLNNLKTRFRWDD